MIPASTRAAWLRMAGIPFCCTWSNDMVTEEADASSDELLIR